MRHFFGTVTKFLVAVLSIMIQIANMFMANIIVYEVTEGVQFNCELLLKNKGFWTVTIITFVYYAIPFIIKQKNDSVDEALEEAFSNGSVALVNSITESAQNGDFESSRQMMKILDQIQKRRRK